MIYNRQLVPIGISKENIYNDGVREAINSSGLRLDRSKNIPSAEIVRCDFVQVSVALVDRVAHVCGYSGQRSIYAMVPHLPLFISFLDMFTCRVSVRAVGDIYGVETIFIIDGLDFIPQLRFMIRGTPSQDEDVVAGKFGKCHRESMDSVGMEGQFEFEEFYERIVRSVKSQPNLWFGMDSIRFREKGKHQPGKPYGSNRMISPLRCDHGPKTRDSPIHATILDLRDFVSFPDLVYSLLKCITSSWCS